MSSAELAAAVVDELVRLGVREAVLSPGSRNAPLSYALVEAEAAGGLRLHVRIDERAAGFLALGLATASGLPVPVVTTSGTAAANLHPAVLEASHRGAPLLALTADRPPHLVGTGANQTTDQVRLYGDACRWYVGLDSLDPSAARPAVDRALGWATGAMSRDPGPVQIDLAFREPLVAATVDLSDDPRMPTAVGTMDVLGSVNGPEPVPRTLVVAGGAPGPWTAYAALAAERRGWPVVAEASAGFGVIAVPHGGLLLDATEWLDAHAPDQVVVVGNPTLHRSVQRLLARPDVEVIVVSATPRWPDAARAATKVVAPGWLRAVADLPGPVDEHLKQDWLDAGAAAAAAVASVTAADGALGWPAGAAVARAVVAALPEQAVLQVASSNPVRDVDLAAAPRADIAVLTNRGLAGIDGTLSTASGAALALAPRPAYALIGDLAFLHDLNGLLIGPDEPTVDLTVVVCNDDGGGIFATLEQGGPNAPAGFERVFGTPTRASVESLAAGVNAAHERIGDPTALAAALAKRPSGVTVLEVSTSRAERAAQSRALVGAVRDALGLAGSTP
ncbi:2-succinyl-5-enolpyruvyl-6-hydroxy-3-cyclohexene-1-carboxylic-acid synthase [Jatrophihabitans sp. YIM 134969]